MRNNSNNTEQAIALPFVTLAIVSLCLLSALWLQDGDQQLEQQAAAEYQRLELGKFELPLFIRYLREQGDDQHVDQLQSLDVESARTTARRWIDISPSFLDAMWSGHYLPIASAEYRRWQERRTRYDSLLDRSVSHQFRFKFDQPDAATWLGYTLLSDTSTWRWLGGLMLLLLACLLTERLAGPMIAALGWATGSLGAAIATFSFEGNRLLTLIGADAATTGMLTLSLLLSLLLRRPWLIAWSASLALAWIALQIYWPSSIVTPWWHAGAALSALLIALVLGLVQWHRTRQIGDLPVQIETTELRKPTIDDESAIRSASELVSAGDHKLALRIADEILGRSPDHLSAWQVKVAATLENGPIDVDHPAHAVIEQLALRRDAPDQWNTFATEQFEAYLRATNGKSRLSLRAIMALAQRYMAIGKLDSAQRLLSAVERKAPNAPPVKRMRQALLNRTATSL